MIEQQISQAVFLVEATSCEQHALWREFSPESDYVLKHTSVRTWKQNRHGEIVVVGYVDECPVCVSFFSVKINGHLVVFYEATSRVVDYKLIEDWLERTFKGRWDNGSRRAVTNAMNFHHCLHALAEKEENDLKKLGEELNEITRTTDKMIAEGEMDD